jgi:hypothetical protein
MFSGTAPKRNPVRAAGIPGGAILMEDLVLDPDNHVQWAFVYIKQGLEGKSFEAATSPLELMQAGMTYQPHVLGVRVDQPLVVRNRDAELHSIHSPALPQASFSGDLTGRGDERVLRFSRPEIMSLLRCDVHPWMKAWVGVMDHPFFAVTDAAGNFEIRNLSAGKYRVGLWHERLKAEDRDIEVSGDMTLDFSCALK